MKTVPIVIPLTNGLTENTDSLDARRPGIEYAENIDFTMQGAVSGRPSFVSKDAFTLRTLNNTAPLQVTSAAPVTVDTLVSDSAGTRFNGLSMFRYRDANGERPGATTNGRVWTHEDSAFVDRLYCGSARVDRLAELFHYELGNPSNIPTGRTLPTPNGISSAAYNFAIGKNGPGLGNPLLAAATPSIESYEPNPGNLLFGGSADVFTALGTYHCSVGNDGINNQLILTTRKNDDLTLSRFVIAADCASVLVNVGEAPTCCYDTSGNAQVLFVAYIQTGLANYVLLRVNPVTGAVVTGPVATPLANIIGLWITAQTNSNRIMLAFTRTGIPGVTLRQHVSTTLVLNAAANATLDGAAATNPTGPVVIGGTSSGKTYVEYQKLSAFGTATSRSVLLGTYEPTGPVTTIIMSWEGFFVAATPTTLINWAIPFSPIQLSNRTIIGLSVVSSEPGPGYTWFALDVTDVNIAAGESKPCGTLYPGLLASGAQGTQSFPFCPTSATTNDGVSFRFASLDYTSFAATTASNPSYGINSVTLMSPAADSVGEQTILSGSIPHGLSRGYCYEVGFLQNGAPELHATVAAGGSLAVGTYTLQAVWRWIDEAGITHRSAPSQVPVIGTTAGANLSLTVVVQNLQLTQREYGTVMLEVYSTAVNPTPTSQKFLQMTITPGAGPVTTALLGGPIDVTSLPLYTANGAVLQNFPVSGDGGVATVNNRMWLSDGKAVYASKVYKSSGDAIAWNDEGSLTLFPPAPAGRVLALAPLDDKLVILCERGVYFTQGEGPDDTGTGPGFLVPVQATPLGISNSLGYVATDAGVIFHSTNTLSAGPGYGGVYLLDGGIHVGLISAPAQQEFGSGNYVLAYIPEKQLLVATNPAGFSNLIVLDMRNKAWCIWTPPNGSPGAANGGQSLGITASNGLLWAGFAPGSLALGSIGSYSGVPGSDTTDTVQPVQQLVRTNIIYANSQDGLGWARVRGVSVLGSSRAASTLAIAISTDQLIDASATIPTDGVTFSSTWPSFRYAPEFRLANQKCSQIQVTLLTSPAEATWAALRLDILPSHSRAPSNNRTGL